MVHPSSSAATIHRLFTGWPRIYLAQKLAQVDPTVSKVTRSGKLGAGWKGFISAEAQQTVERGAIPELHSIDDAISIVGFIANKHSQQPVVVIDEFERIKDAGERMLFADFIKQVGDQSVPLKLIFCGIGSALSELLDSHHSCYRYLTAVPLERLGPQPRLEIIRTAAQAFGIVIEDTSQYRIAMISDGFPHYVHLLAEKLMWSVFEDSVTVDKTTPQQLRRRCRNSRNRYRASSKGHVRKGVPKIQG